MNAKGERIESSKLRRSKNRTEKKWLSFSEYFTLKNKYNSPIVEAESRFLQDNSYDLEKGFYYTLVIPPDLPIVNEVFFLFAQDEKEKEAFNKKLKELTQRIESLLLNETRIY